VALTVGGEFPQCDSDPFQAPTRSTAGAASARSRAPIDPAQLGAQLTQRIKSRIRTRVNGFHRRLRAGGSVILAPDAPHVQSMKVDPSSDFRLTGKTPTGSSAWAVRICRSLNLSSGTAETESGRTRARLGRCGHGSHRIYRSQVKWRPQGYRRSGEAAWASQ
jgi:hypothetical protein